MNKYELILVVAALTTSFLVFGKDYSPLTEEEKNETLHFWRSKMASEVKKPKLASFSEKNFARITN